jgi:hypothetical protein
MRDYNGFDARVRVRSIHGQRRLYADGRPKPYRCLACGVGEPEATIGGHWETYFEPWGLNYDLPLCAICHLWVHCRFGDDDVKFRFASYAAQVAHGFRSSRPIASIAGGYNEFRARFLVGFKAEGLRGGELLTVRTRAENPRLLFDIANGTEYRKAVADAIDCAGRLSLLSEPLDVPEVPAGQWFDAEALVR